ncbi:alpha/beta fold hydrolase [Acidipila sp. EB88]|uniref:alpha/beta fold hydrolase n=1 Tax=Acidipila sp. EB88 TaxID=2305226 RepID=UPI00131540F5|nr:alpha/beta fold hydrolase [Acidipila sp. EB88]
MSRTVPSGTDAPSTEQVAIRACDALIDGYRMHALVAGAGAPVVLVHGLLGAAAAWMPVMRVLAREATVYAVDAIGIGQSERVRGIDGSLQASARRLALWMDHAGLERVDLVGTSHGGAVAMCFAAMFPQRVRSLLLHAPANPFCMQSQPQIRFAGTRIGRRVAHWLPAAPSWVHQAALCRMYGDPTRVRAGSLEEYVESLRRPGTVEYILSVLRHWVPDMTALVPMLPRLRKLPTMLLWGAQDRAVSLSSAWRLRAVLRAPLEILPELGHLPFEEAPELFADRILRFVADTAGRASVVPLRTA